MKFVDDDDDTRNRIRPSARFQFQTVNWNQTSNNDTHAGPQWFSIRLQTTLWLYARASGTAMLPETFIVVYLKRLSYAAGRRRISVGVHRFYILQERRTDENAEA